MPAYLGIHGPLYTQDRVVEVLKNIIKYMVFDTLISFKLQIGCKYTGMNVMSIKLRGSYWDYMQCRTDRL